jgi:hypothetical protein
MTMTAEQRLVPAIDVMAASTLERWLDCRHQPKALINVHKCPGDFAPIELVLVV